MAGGRPSKPIQLVKGHRTKAEKEVREEAEKSLLTGTSLKEWPDIKKNKIAHTEFARIRKLLKAIDKDDGLHEAVINRYCLLIAECKEFEQMKTRLYGELEELGQAYYSKEMEFLDYLQEKNKLQDKIFTCDKKVMEKRKMMLDIEKENIMTIASALRSIPKKPEDKVKSPMAAFLNRKRAEGNGS